ncbi:hypothetical protein H6768_05075 [Candidatus Peribacteria bacterium]|nr:hypothetical protein [Candidatus Peribacteria bacterium]
MPTASARVIVSSRRYHDVDNCFTMAPSVARNVAFKTSLLVYARTSFREKNKGEKTSTKKNFFIEKLGNITAQKV